MKNETGMFSKQNRTKNLNLEISCFTVKDNSELRVQEVYP